MIEKKRERVLLVGLNLTDGRKRQIHDMDIDIDVTMEELEELAKAAGGEVVGVLVQNKPTIDVGYYIGKGKAEELGEYATKLEADLIVVNDELSGAQLKNLEEATQIDVIDRTQLILDIFAQRALSKEGKLQVELAQMKYRLPRLIGLGRELSRTGGGIGTRGPGETKLETDKRHIRSRIDDIRRELKEVAKNREVQRSARQKSELPIVALIGYTNAGKSSLLNELIKTHKDYQTEKQVFAKDMLFATLDVSLRKAVFPSNREYLVTDTVGFVSKLPHYLVEAFKSTLEEVKYADVLLHVVDASNENYELQMATTLAVLKELDCLGKPMLTIYNKMDKIEYEVSTPREDESIFVSCKTGYNMDLLVQNIEDMLIGKGKKVEMLIPYDKGSVVNYLHGKTVFEVHEYREDGIYIETVLDDADYGKWKEFILNYEEEIED